jgi:hypothetical protein
LRDKMSRPTKTFGFYSSWAVHFVPQENYFLGVLIFNVWPRWGHTSISTLGLKMFGFLRDQNKRLRRSQTFLKNNTNKNGPAGAEHFFMSLFRSLWRTMANHYRSLSRSLFPMIILRIPVVIDKIKLNNNAHQKLRTSKPSINLSVRIIMSPLMTIKNNPNDRIVIGIVKMVRIGFTMAFIKANTRATKSDVVNASTLTPGKR